MATNSYPAKDERIALCDLFVEVGPGAPTLCGDWTTRDLAAHLVMRERRPDGAIGIVVPKAAGYADKVQTGIAARDWVELVERVRGGPPVWSPTKIAKVDKLINTVEFFVHHEDVRRGVDGWEPRDLDGDLAVALYGSLSKFGKRFVRSAPVGIVFEPTDGKPPIVAKEAEPSVTVRGDIGELILFAFGRQAHCNVELFGDDASIEAVTTASFGM